jgi:hypothetical protein
VARACMPAGQQSASCNLCLPHRRQPAARWGRACDACLAAATPCRPPGRPRSRAALPPGLQATATARCIRKGCSGTCTQPVGRAAAAAAHLRRSPARAPWPARRRCRVGGRARGRPPPFRAPPSCCSRPGTPEHIEASTAAPPLHRSRRSKPGGIPSILP